ncbi:MAG: hypothetical protein IBX40_07455 [Methanosarcinales archaeon]|nr:hypothetical protein [Methanosarcinales archaeon]
MARKLTSRDMELLRKMVPELDIDNFPPAFRSILPPVSKRFSSSGQEFKSRLDALSTADLEYLADLIFQGDECLSCLEDEYLDILLDRIKDNISHKKAEDLMELLGYIKEG